MKIHYDWDYPNKPVAIDCPACAKPMPLNPVGVKHIDKAFANGDDDIWPSDWVCDDCETFIFGRDDDYGC